MAASKEGQALKKQLSQRLREALGKKATVQQLEGYQDLIDAMSEGRPAPEVADVLTRKIINLALDPNRVNQWAVELIYERVEGKAAQQQSTGDQGRAIDERLNDVTTEHLNDLAKQFAEQEGGSGQLQPAAQETASGQMANPLMDLPQDGPGGPQDPGSES